MIVVKGWSESNKPVLGRPTKQDVRNDKGDMDRHGVDLWKVGTDTAKSALFARLDGDLEHELPAERLVRFSQDLPASFFEGITAEYYDTDTGKWVKRPGRRNEPLDTWVYAYAAAHHPRLAIQRAGAADWDELERLLEPRVHDLFTAPAVQTSALPAPAAPAAEAPAAVDHRDPGEDWVPDLPDHWL